MGGNVGVGKWLLEKGWCYHWAVRRLSMLASNLLKRSQRSVAALLLAKSCACLSDLPDSEIPLKGNTADLV